MDEWMIPMREIDEHEDALLEGLWEGMEEAGREERDEMREGAGRDGERREREGEEGGWDEETEAGWRDVRERVRKRERARRRRRGLWRGGAVAAMAVMAAGVWMVWQREAKEVRGVEVLAEVSREWTGAEVRMTVGEDWCVEPGAEARMEEGEDGKTGVLAREGERLEVKAGERVKVEVPAGKRFRLELGDGTEVWLNGGSRLEYPGSFRGEESREVWLSGEAFFGVRRDIEKPFVVHFGSGESVRVLGTEFNVRAYEEDGQHETTLVEGSIRYRKDEGDEGRVMVPNEQAVMECGTGRVTVREVEGEAYGEWRDGVLRFEEERLEKLAVRMERAYGVQVEVEEGLRGCTFTGKIRVERGVGHVLELLKRTAELEWEVQEGVIYLRQERK